MRAADVESDLQEHPHLEIKPKFLSKRDSFLKQYQIDHDVCIEHSFDSHC